jgi:hypothetical protein
VNPVLPDSAVEFAEAADKAVEAAGGVDLARAAEADPRRRADAGRLLAGLGVADLDPRADSEAAAAAAELCRVAGRHALPWPVVAVLLADGDGRPLALAGAGPGAPGATGHRRVDHGELYPEWRVAAMAGTAVVGRPAGGALGSKLGPFVTDLEPAGPAAPAGPAEVALHLTLTAWRLLGTAERAVDLAVEHVRDRHQFGQPLAAFQAVQFQVADAVVACDGLRELCRYTLWQVGSGGAGAWTSDPLALRLHALDVTRSVLRTAQQLFGAAGLCDEYDVSVLLRHAQPDLRLPFGAEETAWRLFGAVEGDGFAALFPHGGRREEPGR